MNRALRRWLPGARWAVIVIPFAWLLLFFAIPFAIALKISFASSAIAMPPYTDLVSWDGDKLAIHLNVGNYLFLRSEEHTSELQSLMRISYAVFCLKKKNNIKKHEQ